METTIFDAITKYGLNTLIIAICINILTGIIKLPLKAWAAKLKDSSKITRYITFLPIILGFGLTILYIFIMNKKIIIDNKTITLWLTSSSLSLAIYAFLEKFIPSKEKIMEESEIMANQKLINKLKELTSSNAIEESEAATGENENIISKNSSAVDENIAVNETVEYKDINKEDENISVDKQLALANGLAAENLENISSTAQKIILRGGNDI